MLTPTASPPTLRLAIYRASSLGDVVLASTCLDLLRHLPIPTEVSWIGRGAALEVIGSSWPNVKPITVNRSDSMRELRKVIDQLAKVHLFVDLQCNIRSNWLARNLKTLHGVPYFSAEKAQLARNRLIFEARLRGRRRLLPERARAVSKPQFLMMADALKQGLRFQLPLEMRDGLDSIPCRPRLPIPANLDPPWRKELRFGQWLAIAPGAAHVTKQAPMDLTLAIIDELQQLISQISGPRLNTGIVFLGDNKDSQFARQLIDKLTWNGPLLNLAGKLSLWETAIALSECSCLLSNDSSLGHIAEAVDTPTGVLFGPTIESFGFAPRMNESRAFSSLIGCRPCSKHGKQDCRFGDQLCFSTIRPAEVANHLLQLLNSTDERRRTNLKQSIPSHWPSQTVPFELRNS